VRLRGKLRVLKTAFRVVGLLFLTLWGAGGVVGGYGLRAALMRVSLRAWA
jgi:hypothetical protein